MTRLSFEPLAVECRLRWRPTTETGARSAGDIFKVCEVLGVGKNRVVRWRKNGVSLEAAEEIGQILGVHPASIWMREWWCAA